MSEVKKKKTIPKKKKKKSKARRFFKYFFLTLLLLFIIGSVVAGGYVFAVIKNAPALDVNQVLTLNQPSRVYDADGKVMDDVIDTEQRYVIPLKDIPSNLQNAFISIEDERFYSHGGVDVKRILGAAFTDAKKFVTGKAGLHGASTLTQQLLKNTILSNEISVDRKVKEIYLAIQLEKYLDKNKILEAYLNTIPLGGNVYGVEAAAYQYFGIPANQLNLIQCAYIAGTTQAPSYYNALTEKSKKNPTPYLNRTKTVLSKMLENKKISQTEYDKAIKDIDNGQLKFNPVKKTNRLNFEWFTRPVIAQVKKDLKEKYKYTDEEVSKMLVNGGLTIHSTMDRKLQNYTQEVLDSNDNLLVGNDKNEMIQTADKKYIYPALQASATIMDYHTGQVKAMVGGRNSSKGTQPPGTSNNRAYFGYRPTGSSVKPLTVYGPAVDMKVVTPSTTFEDSPLSNDELKIGHFDAQPMNQDRQYRGTVTIREAIRQSLNVVAIKVEEKIGVDTGLAYGQKFGMKYNAQSKSSIASIALGQFNNDPSDRDGANTTTMAAAFGTFGNSGNYTEPILYTTVEDANHNVILQKAPAKRRVVSTEAAYIMYDLLKTPVETYSAKTAKFGDIPVAGKTGTTSNNSDLWFSGFTPYLSAAIWVGYDNPRELLDPYGTSNVSSGSVAGTLWGMIMKKAHDGLQFKDIPKPDGVIKGAVCMDSGKLATDLCKRDPRGNRVVEDLFIGTSSSSNELCDVHVTAKVNKLNGKLATENTPANLIEERVFINKKLDPSSPDYKYMLPTEKDDTKPAAETKPATDTKQNPDKGNPAKTNPSPQPTTDPNNTDPSKTDPNKTDPNPKDKTTP
ncbi:transglycosylase domain-containing protein [Inconstantimicrobium mannanitabidum]|uniref:Penicillin-binding protein 1A n=1 Tax=Inconstantimicrobium mannanitabidum TaxID=1604901 RepID=A0ACB5R9X7_9CLOT|nr:PBP1A family penicillin-binding protein [Clostridium sp. TW13]GKX65999.1 penicillin-binding protein 1A [Clostridium sp. TW13]